MLGVVGQKLDFLSGISAALEKKPSKILQAKEIEEISNRITPESFTATLNNMVKTSDFFNTNPFLIPLGIKIFGESFYKNLTLLFRNMWGKIMSGQAFVADIGIQEEFCMNFKKAVSELQNFISSKFPEK